MTVQIIETQSKCFRVKVEKKTKSTSRNPAALQQKFAAKTYKANPQS